MVTDDGSSTSTPMSGPYWPITMLPLDLPDMISSAICRAELMGIAKPSVEADWSPKRVLLCDPAVSMPMTLPALSTRGPPESPGTMLASVSIIPLRFSERSPSLAVIDWSRPVMVPLASAGVPPRP